MSARLKLIFGIILAIICVALFYTYPLVFTMSFRLPGFEQSDTYLSVWNIWHLNRTIFAGFDLFNLTTKYIFYPQAPSLFLHNYIITSGLMSLPFQAVFSPIISMNLVFLIQFMLTGLGMYLLVSHFTAGRFAGFWSAITLAFCPYVVIQSCYFLHFSSIWFFPWFIFFFWKFLDQGGLAYGVGAAAVYALCLLEDQTYFLFMSILAVLIIVFFLAEKRKIRGKTFIQNAAISSAVFFVLASWYLAGLIRAAAGTHTAFPVWPDTAIDYFSLRASGLLRPSPLLAVYRAMPYLCTPIMHITNVFAGYVPLFFACLALLRFKKFTADRKKIIIFWAVTGIIFYLLASGPLIFGSVRFLNGLAPYNLLCAGPLRQLRIPVRFALITLIALYVIAAFGIEQFMDMKRRFIKSGLCVGLFLILLQIIEFLPASYPLLDLTVPEVYFTLAQRDPGSPVLVLPLGWQSSYKTVGCYNKETQYFQTIHEHPIFQGQIARIDDRYFDYYTSQPGFRYLMEAHKRAPTAAEQNDVYRILDEYGVKNVVIVTKYFDKKSLLTLLDALAIPLQNKKLQLLSY